MVVGFEGDRFTGQILAELRAAKEKGIIRVVDLSVLKKDGQGNVMALELSDVRKEEAAELGPLAGDLLGLFAQEDIEQAAASIPNKSAAGLLLFEHTWAIGLRDAIKKETMMAQDVEHMHLPLKTVYLKDVYLSGEEYALHEMISAHAVKNGEYDDVFPT